MFFNRNKNKLKGQQRFQHRKFTQQLDQARNYKRQARYVPEHPVDIFLTRLGLGNRWSQILTGLIILGALYLVYFPNFLSVQQVEVRGLSSSDKTIAEGTAKQVINHAFFLNPQRNLVFLSERRVRDAVASLPNIYKVTQVKKDFKSKSLLIEVQPKYERFLVSDSQTVYGVYNDGVLKARAGITQSDFPTTNNASMLKVVLPQPVHPADNQQFFSPETVEQMEAVAREFQNIPSSPLVQIFVGTVTNKQVLNDDGSTSVQPNDLEFPIKSEEIKVDLQKGQDVGHTFAVIFDAQSDLHDAIVRFNLLLSQTAPDRYKNLFYIDMRIKNRGYICLINAPCAK